MTLVICTKIIFKNTPKLITTFDTLILINYVMMITYLLAQGNLLVITYI